MKNISLLGVFLAIKTCFYYRYKFKAIGWRSAILKPLRIDHGKNISIGDRVFVGYKSWLAASPLTGHQDCKLIIDDGCTIGNFNHIYSTHEVILEKHVLTADKVYISDNIHGYEDVTSPIMTQPVVQKKTVRIGTGSWLGENVCVIGASIGAHSVIGANSVVTTDIPSFSVAVGAPARVIKKYNFYSKKWEKF